MVFKDLDYDNCSNFLKKIDDDYIRLSMIIHNVSLLNLDQYIDFNRIKPIYIYQSNSLFIYESLDDYKMIVPDKRQIHEKLFILKDFKIKHTKNDKVILLIFNDGSKIGILFYKQECLKEFLNFLNEIK
ncbi:hypothetical protein A0H76_1713 [Hepatospora eriocheir]|uniref:Uncharacterized protein n=1 Tax=Hepatospora eriocheir TaxID=1081669 RepID=A0A1X0QGY5_9MICR|nr:hypothetical protein A0H76_1713 [Hepatospora eriocheir]